MNRTPRAGEDDDRAKPSVGLKRQKSAKKKEKAGERGAAAAAGGSQEEAGVSGGSGKGEARELVWQHNPVGVQEYRTCDPLPSAGCIEARSKDPRASRSCTGIGLQLDRSCDTITTAFSYNGTEGCEDEEAVPFAASTDYGGDLSAARGDIGDMEAWPDEMRRDSSDEEEEDENESDSFAKEDFQLYAAALLFILGCCLFFPWVFGATCFLKPKNKKARCFAVLSLVAATVAFTAMTAALMHKHYHHKHRGGTQAFNSTRPASLLLL